MSNDTKKPGPLAPSAPPRDVLDAAKAYVDASVKAAVGATHWRIDGNAAAIDALTARVEELEKVRTWLDRRAEVAARRGDDQERRLIALEEGAKGVAVPLATLQQRVTALEERIREQQMLISIMADEIIPDRCKPPADRGLAPAQAGQGSGDHHGAQPGRNGATRSAAADDGREPGPIEDPRCDECGQTAACIGHYDGDISDDDTYRCGDCCDHAQDAGSCRDVEPGHTVAGPSSEGAAVPAIEVGQVWRWIDGDTFTVESKGEGERWDGIMIGESGREITGSVTEEALRYATLVEPAPKHWPANVPEPPPVEMLSAAADYLGGGCAGARPDWPAIDRACAWLRAVAAAMEGDK